MLNTRFRILQLEDIENSAYSFMSYDFAKAHGLKLSDYCCTFDGQLDQLRTAISDEASKIEILEALFREFNRVTPADVEWLNKKGFTGSSLSCSDIIELDNDYYYCDFSGWRYLNEDLKILL